MRSCKSGSLSSIKKSSANNSIQSNNWLWSELAQSCDDQQEEDDDEKVTSTQINRKTCKVVNNCLVNNSDHNTLDSHHSSSHSSISQYYCNSISSWTKIRPLNYLIELLAKCTTTSTTPTQTTSTHAGGKFLSCFGVKFIFNLSTIRVYTGLWPHSSEMY